MMLHVGITYLAHWRQKYESYQDGATICLVREKYGGFTHQILVLDTGVTFDEQRRNAWLLVLKPLPWRTGISRGRAFASYEGNRGSIPGGDRPES